MQRYKNSRSIRGNVTFLEYGYALAFLSMLAMLCVPFITIPVDGTTSFLQICSSDGIRTVSLADTDDPAPEGLKIRHCPLCWVRHQTIAAPPQEIMPERPVLQVVAFIRPGSDFAAVRAVASAPFQQRGPPVSPT